MTKLNLNTEQKQNIQTRIVELLNRKNGSWNGTMTELNRAITSGIRKTAPSFWPKTPSVLRRALNTVIPSLRRSGVRVQFARSTDHSRTRFISIEQN